MGKGAVGAVVLGLLVWTLNVIRAGATALRNEGVKIAPQRGDYPSILGSLPLIGMFFVRSGSIPEWWEA